MKRFILTALVSLTLISCKAEDGNSLQLGGVIKAEADCSIKVSGKTTKTLVSGSLDPAGGQPYSLGVLAFNYLRSTDKDKAETPDTGKANIRSYGNTLSPKSFDVCYYVKTSVADYNNARETNGRNLQASNCTNDDVSDEMFPVYYESVLASGILEPSKAAIIEPGFVTTEVFSKDALREIFGADFDAGGLLQSLTEAENPDARTNKDSRVTTWGIPSADNPAWGEFPLQSTNSVETVIEFRLIAETQAGTEVTSNWVTFPVTIQVLQYLLECDGLKRYEKNCKTTSCYEAGGTPEDPKTENDFCVCVNTSGSDICECTKTSGEIIACLQTFGPAGHEPQNGGECNVFQDNNLARATCPPMDDPCEE